MVVPPHTNGGAQTTSASFGISIPQNQKKSTGKSKHSVESSSEASKQQLQYLIEFQEKKTPGQSNTATKDLLRTDQTSYSNSISQKSKKSTTKAQHSVESSSEAPKQQLQYLIEFKENKTPGQSNTATKDLLRSDQASYSNSISQKSKKSTGKSQHYIVWQIQKRALARYRRSMLLTVRVGLRHRKTELSKPARALLIIVYHEIRKSQQENRNIITFSK